MREPREPDSLLQVLWCLRALGGEATLGDLVAVTGFSRQEMERCLEGLLAGETGHARVTDAGDLVYHLGAQPAGGVSQNGRGRATRGLTHRRWARAMVRRTIFDRKTLGLIRAREGVLSLAELVEQTGLPLPLAEAEMRRLAELWRGEPHAGLDGHTVYAFPDLMSSVLGRFPDREPRPAWVWDEDPMDHAQGRRRRARLGVAATACGATALAGASLLAGPLLGAAGALTLAGAGMASLVQGVRGMLRHHRRFRFRQPDTLRRYALGYVVETALRGKGVVSLKRTVAFIQGRAGKRRVSRKAVEIALRDLAREFQAPVTTEGDDLFFGFRNVKRQFLASMLLRKELALGRTVAGETVFDTADPPEVAAARELEAFDRALGVRVRR